MSAFLRVWVCKLEACAGPAEGLAGKWWVTSAGPAEGLAGKWRVIYIYIDI